MKRVVFLFVMLVCALGSRDARAADDELAPGVLALDERNDTWLHERCSYRGIELYTAELVARPGTITELATVTRGLFDRVQSRRVKTFRCDVRPSFWSGAFVPAPAASVHCEEEAPLPKLCVPPIRRRPAAAGKAEESNASAALVAAAETVTSHATIPMHVAISFPAGVPPPLREGRSDARTRQTHPTPAGELVGSCERTNGCGRRSFVTPQRLRA